MTQSPITRFLAITSGALLALMYAGFALPVIVLYLASSNPVTFAVAATQLARLVLAFSFGRLRKASTLTLFSYFSAEVFLLPLLGALTVFTGDPAYTAILKDAFVGWLPMIPVSLSPFLVVRFAGSMSRRDKLSRILPEGIILFGFLAVALSIYGGASPSNITAKILGAVASEFGQGLQGFESATESVAIVGAGIYLCLLLYSVIRDGLGIREGTKVLALAFVGGLAGLVASLGITFLFPSSVYILALPTLAAAGLVVLATRGS
jgi:hypothetical protein